MFSHLAPSVFVHGRVPVRDPCTVPGGWGPHKTYVVPSRRPWKPRCRKDRNSEGLGGRVVSFVYDYGVVPTCRSCLVFPLGLCAGFGDDPVQFKKR